MSAVDVECTVAAGGRCEFPEFDLCTQVDEEDDPSEVTVFPGDADEVALPTTWLTVDADSAIPLTDAR